MWFLGLLATGILIFVAYVISMLLYFKARRKWSHLKILVEITTVSIALLISMVVKLVIFYKTTPAQFGSGSLSLVKVIANTIENLGFEGLEEYNVNSLLQCLSSGVVLYASLMFISVITAKASYGVYSGVLLSILRVQIKFDKRVDVYVFTSVTEDVLVLSKSIKNEYQNGTKKGRKCKIIFAGYNLDSFDRSNPLHREIIAESYLYLSYSKKKTQCSILRRLKLDIDNDFIINTQMFEKNEIHIFAFGNDEKMTGLESDNGNVIFEEIQSLSYEMLTRTKDDEKVSGTIVNLYLLTKKDINYEYYQNQVKQIIETNVGQRKVDCKKLIKHFQLKIYNEGILSAKNLSNCRYKVLQDLNVDWEQDACLDKVYRALVLGFGPNGQQALQSLFIDTSYVDEEGMPYKFVADVYDISAEEKGGQFSGMHPLFLCAMCKDLSPISLDDKILEKGYERLCKIYGTTDYKKLDEKMGFPVIGLHNQSCFSNEFLEFLDTKTGLSPKTFNKFLYNSVIIALGDDESNLTIGNIILNDIKHEILHTCDKNHTKQTIFINIRDDKNYNRLNWTKQDQENFPNIRVVRFGKYTDLYSYSQIVDEQDSMLYNSGYNTLSEQLYNDKDGFSSELIKILKNEEPNKKYNELIKRTFDIVKNVDGKIGWLDVNIFNKESNASANTFGKYYGKKLFNGKDIYAKDLCLCAKIEHNRWNRFFMANGWIFANYPKEEKEYRRNIKEHTCLRPFDQLSDVEITYDILNIFLAYRYSKN